MGYAHRAEIEEQALRTCRLPPINTNTDQQNFDQALQYCMRSSEAASQSADQQRVDRLKGCSDFNDNQIVKGPRCKPPMLGLEPNCFDPGLLTTRIRCPVGQFYDTPTHQCKSAFAIPFVGGVNGPRCKPPLIGIEPNCVDPKLLIVQPPGGTGTITCPAGYYYDVPTHQCKGGSANGGTSGAVDGNTKQCPRDASGTYPKCTCNNGAPFNADLDSCPVAMKACPDGSKIPASQTCPVAMKTCPDGSKIPANQICPVATKTCPDGSKIPANQNCPVARRTCPDGSKIPTNQNCPVATKTCPDGSKIPANQNCPVVMKTCPGGSKIPANQNCPVTSVKCNPPFIGFKPNCTCPPGTQLNFGKCTQRVN